MAFNKRKGFPVQFRRGFGAAAPFALNYVKNAATRGAQRFIKQGRLAIGSMARKYIRTKIGTKTKRTRTNNVKIEGVGGQLSKFKVARPLSPFDKKLIKDLAPQYWLTNSGQRLATSPGLQATAQYFMFGAYKGGLGDANADLWNIYQNVAAIQPSTITSGQKRTSKFMVASGNSKWMMTNQDSGNVCVEIYDIAVRRDVATDPANAFYQGLIDQASASGAGTPSQIPGALPTQSAMFNTYFKVLQKTRVIMGAGQSHTHYQNVKPNKWLNSEIFYSYGGANNASVALRGFTLCTMIVAHGMPYNDLTTQTQVSTGAVALDIVYTKQVKYYILSEEATTTYATNALPNGFNVQEEVMTTGSGYKTGDIPA
jgi:hypothetical protein